MTSTFTQNKSFEEPGNGDTGWDVPLNDNFTAMDKALGSSVAISVGSVVSTTPVPLTLAQYQCMTLIFSGVLSVNATYQVPTGVGGNWLCVNNTSGAFTLKISQQAGGPTATIGQGTTASVYTDGTNNGVLPIDTRLTNSGAVGSVGVFDTHNALKGNYSLTNDGDITTLTTNTAPTNAVKFPLTVIGETTGTPAPGIGAGITVQVETAPSVNTNAMLFYTYSTDITPSSEDFDLLIQLMTGGAMTEAMHLNGAGDMIIKGTYNVIMGQKPIQNVGQSGITNTFVYEGIWGSSANYTPSPVNGTFKAINNAGPFSISAPSYAGDYQMVINVFNNGGAGAITLSGFTKASGSFDAVVGHNFFLNITKCNGFTYAEVIPLF